MSKLDLDHYVPYLVNRVGMIIAERFSAETLAPYRLSIAMWRVMAVLASNGSQRQIDLADLTSIDASTLSRIVTRLIVMGIVSRARSAASPREVAVSLTAKGRAIVAKLLPAARDCEAAAVAGLRAEELAALKKALRRIYANMTERQQPAPSAPRPAKRGRPRRATALAAE